VFGVDLAKRWQNHRLTGVSDEQIEALEEFKNAGPDRKVVMLARPPIVARVRHALQVPPATVWGSFDQLRLLGVLFAAKEEDEGPDTRDDAGYDAAEHKA
jgi:hypothetical protein